MIFFFDLWTLLSPLLLDSDRSLKISGTLIRDLLRFLLCGCFLKNSSVFSWDLFKFPMAVIFLICMLLELTPYFVTPNPYLLGAFRCLLDIKSATPTKNITFWTISGPLCPIKTVLYASILREGRVIPCDHNSGSLLSRNFWNFLVWDDLDVIHITNIWPPVNFICDFYCRIF